MVKWKNSAYKPLSVRKQHAFNMKVVIASLFGVLVLTGITGHLFSRRETTTPTPPQPSPHHEALAKLIRTSEDAINWIGNKTMDSINNIRNLTASAGTPESPLVAKKNKLLNWLRGIAHYNDSSIDAAVESPESSDAEVAEDSGEKVVIAHRSPGHGFSWGPPKNNKSSGDNISDSPGLLHAAEKRIHGVFSYLYQTSKNMTQRGKEFLLAGINKVKETQESLKNKRSKSRKQLNDATTVPGTTVSDVDGSCEDGSDNVCAVDWGRNIFTVFQNGCLVKVYNQLHGTNFSIQDSDVCIDLFAHQPERYKQTLDPSL